MLLGLPRDGLASLAALVGLLGCERDPRATRNEVPAPTTPPAAAPSPALKEAAPEQAVRRAVPEKPRRDQEVALPAATLYAGSPTGSKDRNPAREADHVARELAAFAIDALPYPNDPALPARSGASKREAEQLCAERGKRLCSELEWELACKGSAQADYPSTEPFDAAHCATEPTACYSDLGVFALGTLGREWTSSEARNGDWDRMRSAVVRGALKDAPAASHRCAARDAAAPESRSESLLFRCCRGPQPTAEYPSAREQPAFSALNLDERAAREKLKAMPETEALAASFHLHTPSRMLSALALAGRSSQSLAPWQAATPAFAWSPVAGEELVILSGDAQAGAALIAFYPTEQGPRFAGSLVTKDEHAPILVAYKSDTRDELLYSTCWGCGGEGGALRLDASSRLRFFVR